VTDGENGPEHEHGYSICVSEEEVMDMAAGYCPKTVRAMCRMLIETDDERCRRNAEKPLARKPVR